jgi:hypothetical protein
VKTSLAPVENLWALPGVRDVRTATVQAIDLSTPGALRDLADSVVTPEIAEDCRSLLESAPFVVRYGEMSEPIRCECCGILVGLVPEAEMEWGRPFADLASRPGVWEARTGRKHTMRRCDWRREHP